MSEAFAYDDDVTIYVDDKIKWQTGTTFCGDCTEITISSSGGALEHLPEKSVLIIFLLGAGLRLKVGSFAKIVIFDVF